MAPGVTEVVSQVGTGEVSSGITAQGGSIKPSSTTNDTRNGAAEAEDKPELGMQCDIHNLYQKQDQRGRCTWTAEYPNDLDDPAENEFTARYAILVRNKKSYDSHKKLEIDSIVVQSPLLKNVLSKVLKDYPGITTTLKRVVFHAPFHPFVHRWTEFTSALDEQHNEATKQHLQLLYSTLAAELQETIASKNDYIKNKVITFNHLWTILQPGCTMYTQEWDRDCSAKFASGSYGEHARYGPCYYMNCQRVDWDGDKFGYASIQYVVRAFAGTMKIANLDAFPLEFHPQQKKVAAALIKRGKLFEHYHGYHYMMYKSYALGKNMCGQDIKVTVDSRIIIDTFAYGKFNPNSLPNLSPLKIKSLAAASDNDDQDDDDDDVYESDYDHEEDEEFHAPGAFDAKDQQHFPLNDEQLMHCTPLLKGYALKAKRWLSFFVDAVSDITWNEAAFSSLVLPADQKRLILAFAVSQVENGQAFDDVISGKGKGIIMLLSGGPGIGKTLTAESVAETMKVPLYMMSAGDLGVRSSEVESSLTNILEMVAKWKAVLLLDECDVFLEARSAHDLERNKIVSIFLRTLEYYEGILFLTTNRVKNMDPAFQSRIHISMEYPSLDFDARKQVWANFLARDGAMEHEIMEEEVALLAKVEMNGRQIKNVLKTAGLLASHEKAKLKYEHLNTVLNVERNQPEVGSASA